MSFTQNTTTEKSICDGCSEHCELGGWEYAYITFADIYKFGRTHSTGYYPTIGGKIIYSYKGADGTIVSTERRAKTEAEAIQLAREISKLCDNYKKKQDNQR